MTFAEFLFAYFNIGTLNRLIEARTPVTSVVMDRVFINRANRATDTISLAQIKRVTKSQPVISRGGRAIPLDPKNAAATKIEPLSIRLSDFISGADLNRLRSLYGDGNENAQALVTTELDKMITDLMSSTEQTRNALAAQSISGKIDYMMDSNGLKERYVIDFGTTKTYTPDLMLDDQSATTIDLHNLLSAMRKTITDTGLSGTPIVMAGSNAFSTIANLITVTPESGRNGATVSGTHISLLGYDIYLNDDTYTDADAAGNEVVKPAVDTNSLVMVMTKYAELDYLAIDDVSGELQATPFWSRVITSDDPSGYKILSESKPMPLVASEAICWAKITNSLGRRTALTVNVNTAEGKVYAESQLNALTKAKILEIAAERGYDMTKTAEADTKAEVIAEFIALQTAVNG